MGKQRLIDSCKTIVDFLSTGHLAIHLGNFQSILQAIIFLQSARAEDTVVSFACRHLAKDSVFECLELGRALGCGRLEQEARKLLTTVFRCV